MRRARTSSARCRRFQRQDIRVRCGRLCLRNDRFDHRRQLSGARPDAGSRREGCSPLPDVGDVRRQAAAGRIQPLCGRGRNRRHVLHLQIADGEPHPQEGRYHRLGHADLHALYRNRRTRGLCLQGRAHQGDPGEPLPVFRRASSRSSKIPKIKAFFVVQSRQSDLDGDQCGHPQDTCRTDQEEAARPDPSDRRCLRHVRAGLPLADGGAAAQHHRRLFLFEVFWLHRLAAGRSSHCTRSICSTR